MDNANIHKNIMYLMIMYKIFLIFFIFIKILSHEASKNKSFSRICFFILLL